MANANNVKIISENRRARHDYFVLETYEAGIVLQGTEVKSLRAGNTSLKESFIVIRNGEAFIKNWHIAPYEQGNIYNHDPLRTRKLLLNKREINKLDERVQQDGLTLIPLKLYFNRGKVKLELGVCRGKKLYDKRETKKQRDIDRKIAQATRRSRDQY